MIPPTGYACQLSPTYMSRVLQRLQLTVTESDLPRGSHAPPTVSAQVHGVPTYDNGHRAVATTGHHEERPILDIPVSHAVNIQQDPKATHGNQHGNHSKNVAVPEHIRKGCNQHGEAKRGCPWGH